MIPTTEWDGEFIADLAAERAGLGEPEVLHRSRDEHGWWRQAGIDPIKVARRLWNAARQRPARRIFQASGRMVEDHDEGEI